MCNERTPDPSFSTQPHQHQQRRTVHSCTAFTVKNTVGKTHYSAQKLCALSPSQSYWLEAGDKLITSQNPFFVRSFSFLQERLQCVLLPEKQNKQTLTGWMLIPSSLRLHCETPIQAQRRGRVILEDKQCVWLSTEKHSTLLCVFGSEKKS